MGGVVLTSRVGLRGITLPGGQAIYITSPSNPGSPSLSVQ